MAQSSSKACARCSFFAKDSATGNLVCGSRCRNSITPCKGMKHNRLSLRLDGSNFVHLEQCLGRGGGGGGGGGGGLGARSV